MTRDQYPERWTPEQRADWIRAYNADEPVELPFAEHEPGECDYCDELRKLRAEAEAADEARPRRVRL